MTERKRATIRAFLIAGQADILTKARKGVKGLRMPHLFPLMLVGEYPEGIGATQAGVLSGKSPHNIYQRFSRVIDAGFIRKENKLYYLTDTGQQVYNTIVRESDKAIKEITVLLAAEVRKKLE